MPRKPRPLRRALVVAALFLAGLVCFSLLTPSTSAPHPNEGDEKPVFAVSASPYAPSRLQRQLKTFLRRETVAVFIESASAAAYEAYHTGGHEGVVQWAGVSKTVEDGRMSVDLLVNGDAKPEEEKRSEKAGPNRAGEWKIVAMLRPLRTRFPTRRWFVILDDDTYIFTANLARQLKRWGASADVMAPSPPPLYAGWTQEFIDSEDTFAASGKAGSFVAVHGGSGIVMSGAALDAVIGALERCASAGCTRQDGGGDAQLGCCALVVGLTATHSKHFEPVAGLFGMLSAPGMQREMSYPIGLHPLGRPIPREMLASVGIREDVDVSDTMIDLHAGVLRVEQGKPCRDGPREDCWLQWAPLAQTFVEMFTGKYPSALLQPASQRMRSRE